jgi:Na+-transporting NADH:ubiquinone oxidoreductase subunit NqrD
MNNDQRVIRLVLCVCATVIGFGLFMAAMVLPRVLDRADWSRENAGAVVVAAAACLIVGLVLYPRGKKDS